MASFGIRIENLSRNFREKKLFTSTVLETPSTGLVALCGDNGAGKSTLIKILSTLAAPTSGEAWVGGYSILVEPKKVREKIGVSLATDAGFYRRLTGLENLKLFAYLRGVPSSQIDSEIARWSDVLPLQDALVTPFALASSGMRQALSLCRAFLHKPSVVLLDEPTRSLDQASREKIWKKLQEYSKTMLILVATHRPEEMQFTSSRWMIENQVLLNGSK